MAINSDQTYIPHAGRDPAWPYVSKANSLKLDFKIIRLLHYYNIFAAGADDREFIYIFFWGGEGCVSLLLFVTEAH